MLAELGGRDRLVMAGLVTLGLLTVVAGVVSGRSTLEYVLNKDARDAALSWAGTIDHALGEPGSPRILDKDVQVLDAAKLRDQFPANERKPASVPAESKPKDDHVSRLDGFEPPNRHGLLGARGNRLKTHSRALARRGSDPFPCLARCAHRPAQSHPASPAS